MAPSRSYRILVDGESVYKGSMRSCEVVYKAILQSVKLTNGDPSVPVNLVVDLGGVVVV